MPAPDWFVFMARVAVTWAWAAWRVCVSLCSWKVLVQVVEMKSYSVNNR